MFLISSIFVLSFIREITGFLFLHSIQHLKSLGTLFPNLTLIRGERLFSHYALVIYDMSDLEEVSGNQSFIYIYVASFVCFAKAIFGEIIVPLISF